GRGKTALRADGEALQWNEAACLLDPPPKFGLAFQRISLGRDEAEHDRLLLRHEAQRRETAGARGIVFEEEELDGEPVEQLLGHRLIASLGVPLPAAVSAAEVHADADLRQARKH